MNNKIQVNVNSEIGELEGVILHSPGQELQNMTPETAERALYSDILNLTVASSEYAQLKGTLEKITQTFEVKNLLEDVLSIEKVKTDIINKICLNENATDIRELLLSFSNIDLAKQLVEGVAMKKDNLTKYLQKDKFSLQPLHNFFFTRDASITIRDKVLIGRMASKVRKREALIMESIFEYHPNFIAETVNPENCYECRPELTIEGGDVLIAREDILLIGIGERTSTQGVDFIINELKKRKLNRNIIVQELPSHPESFIHLDMVFTLLDKDKCMVYEPIILKQNKYQTIHIKIDNGEVQSIQNVQNIPEALASLGMNVKPILCGGKDEWAQEREQWHSGANFFAVGPGKVVGYGRNVNTMNELNKAGFEILKAKDIIKEKVKLNDYEKYVISIEGSELSRGGGGARCMTMPIRRREVDW
ncbi:MAG: arginine deiminase family protein [Bacteroidota bacterium]